MKSLYQHMRHDLICKIGFVMIVGLAMTPVSGQTVDSITTPTTVLPQLVWPTSKQYGNNFIRVQFKFLPFGYPSAQLACESYFGPIASAQHTTRLSNTADYDCLINDPESGWRNTYYIVRQSASCPDHYRINGGYSAQGGCSALGCPDTVCKLSGEAINTCPSVPANETPYQLDPGGLTCSRPDQETYTLALKPDQPTTEPSTGLGLTVTVENQDQQAPKSPVAVKISLKVDYTSGGHDHGDGTRPRGGIDGKECETDDTCKTLSIGSEGSKRITFNPTDASGIHTVTATCEKCSNGSQAAEVKVMVEGLSQIPSSPFYRRITPNADTNHPNTHYLKPEASAKLQKIAMAYYAATYLRKDGWLPNVMLNDASLEWGGVLDCYATCLNSVAWGPSHVEHRRGTVIDIRARIPGSNTSHPETLLFEKEFIAQARKAGIDPGKPHNSGNYRHYHLQLNGKAE